MKIYCGIDPGKTGAIALLTEGRFVINVHDMPIESSSTVKDRIDPLGVWAIFQKYNMNHICTAVEKQSSRPGQGVVSVFSLGESWGILRSVSALSSHESLEVAPRTWQKKINRPSTGDSKADSLTMARELFPDYDGLSRKKDHNRADALLLAVYARIMFRNGGGEG